MFLSGSIPLHILLLQFRITIYTIIYQRFPNMVDAMGVCEELGEKGSFLENFSDFEDYEKFHQSGQANPAVQRYCGGGSVPFWLPYIGRKTINSSSTQLSLTHYGSGSQLTLLGMWGPKQPKYSEKFGESPFCVATKLRDDANASWTTTSCKKAKNGPEK